MIPLWTLPIGFVATCAVVGWMLERASRIGWPECGNRSAENHPDSLVCILPAGHRGYHGDGLWQWRNPAVEWGVPPDVTAQDVAELYAQHPPTLNRAIVHVTASVKQFTETLNRVST